MTSTSGVNVQLNSGTAIQQNGGLFCCFGRVEEEPDMVPPDEDFHCSKAVRLPHGYTAYRLLEPSSPSATPAPLALLIHGMYNSGYMWADLAELMAEFEQGPKCRVLVYDMYGRGRSPWTGLPLSLDMYVTQIKELLDVLQLNKSPVHIVGYDLGGAVGSGFAAKFPQLVASLSLIAPLGLRYTSPFNEITLQSKYLGEMHIHRRRQTLPDWQLKDFFKNGMEETHSNLVYKQVNMVKWQLRHSPGFLGALLSTFRYFPLRYMDELFAAIGKHPRKVIIIAGSQDIIAPYKKCIAILEECFPHADVVDVLDAGHNVLHEKFDETTTEILGFLKECMSSAAGTGTGK